MSANLGKIFGCCLVIFASGHAHAMTEIHFSPHGGCETSVVGLIEKSKEQIDVAMYSFNNRAILSALTDAQKRGVRIRMVIDHSQANSNRAATFQIEKAKLPFRLHSSGKIMHDKLGIFDQKTAVTGSFNWTEAAENKNEENCLITDDKKIVAEYDRRFSGHIWPKNTQEKSDRYLSRLNGKLTDRQKSQLAKDQNEL